MNFLTLKTKFQEALVKNSKALLREIQETKELLFLLNKATIQPLTQEEQKKVKEQLLDICKTIPALAVFALPGGAILLPILIKTLPFNILPSNFVEDKKSLPPEEKDF